MNFKVHSMSSEFRVNNLFRNTTRETKSNLKMYRSEITKAKVKRIEIRNILCFQSNKQLDQR